MRVHTNGNVGIGTTSPGYPLEVTGDAYVTSNLGAGIAPNALYGIYGYNALTNTSGVSGGYLYGVHASTSSGTYYTFGSQIQGRDTISSGQTNSGYVMAANIAGYAAGPGTISAVYGARIDAGTITTAGTVTTAYGAYVRLLNQASGTITNSYGVRIMSSVYSGTMTNVYGLYLEDLGGTNVWGVYQAGASDDNYFAGNVGIGTTAPDQPLTIAGSLGGNGLHLDSSSGAGVHIDRGGTTNASGVLWKTAGVADWYLGSYSGAGTSDLFLRAGSGGWSGTDVMAFTTGGNVGIGTTAPGTYKLYVNGNTYIAGTLNVTGTVTAPTFSGIATSAGILNSSGNYAITDSTLPSTLGAGKMRHDFINTFSGGGSAYRSILSISSYTGGHTWTQLAFNYNTGNTESIYYRNNTSNDDVWGSWNKIWSSNNDGTGSTLDADLWDGNQFASYLNQAVLTTSSPTFAGLTISGGNLVFTAANPSITSGSSYITISHGINISGGTAYFTNQLQARGGIHNDQAAYLTIAGGTSAYTYFTGSVGIGDTTPSYLLDVAGTFRTTGAAYLNSTVTIGSTLSVTGASTLTGAVTVPTPTSNMHAATKLYVDTAVAAAGGGTRYSTTYTSNSTWTRPAGVTKVSILAVGGGGGGGGGYCGSYAGGGGGGGAVIWAPDVPVSGNLSVAIGAAGSAGAAQSGNGGDGGTTTVGSISAYGGRGGMVSGGHGGQSGGGSTGGSGISYNINGATGNGGGGGCGYYSGTRAGGDGGGSISPFSGGLSGQSGSNGQGGGGGGASYSGSGGVGGGQAGGNGTGYGSGGGGGSGYNMYGCYNFAGGAGAQGVAIIYWDQ